MKAHSINKCTLLFTLGALSLCAHAATPQFDLALQSVRLDGVRLGEDLTPISGGGDILSLRGTVVYDASDARFHLFVPTAVSSVFPSVGYDLLDVTHATSIDGFNFQSLGNLFLNVGSVSYANFAVQSGSVPPVGFLRVSKQGNTWKLLNWSPNDAQSPSRWGEYNYNTSVSSFGTSLDNFALTHQGPMRGNPQPGPGGFHVGAFGFAFDKLYLRVDSGMGGIARWDYTDAAPPITNPWPSFTSEANPFIGTPYCWGLSAALCGTSIPAYVHNAGRVLEQFGQTIGAYFTFRDWTSGARLDQQVWYLESNDAGSTWNNAKKLFPDSAIFSIDGTATPTIGRFSTAEATLVQNRVNVYFSTIDQNGKFVYVVARGVNAVDGLFADGFETVATN